ncbi:MAG: NUDIX domain-containing protein [Solirubrobacterales bacterium]
MDEPHDRIPGRLRVTGSRTVYENRWIRVREDATERADGTPGIYAVVEKSPGTLVVPVDAGNVWLVEQYRHTVGARLREFPQGAWEDRPDAPAAELAQGELAEETGLRAGRLVELGRLYYAYGMSSQPFTAWLATELEPGPAAPETSESDIRALRVPIDDFESQVRDGTIVDSASVAAWHLARPHLD